MFRRLGNAVVRFWPFLLFGWIVACAAIWAIPLEWEKFSETREWRYLDWDSVVWDRVVTDGEFAFLPEDSSSLQAAQLFRRAFPEDILASAIVIVVRRESHPDGLLKKDKAFIEEVLTPRLERIVKEEGAALEQAEVTAVAGGEANAADVDVSGARCRVRTFKDELIGPLLESRDKKASLVIVELPTEFLDHRNAPLIARIEALIGGDGELRRADPKAGGIPPGLDLATSGSATVGRDMIHAANESARNTELWTVGLVVVLLIVIYRAPIVALIPLLTVAIATKTAIGILALLADAGIINVFRGIEVYVTVLSYGAGVDYCLFLIARYKEELDGGADFEEAVSNALAKVGAALAASAGTVMFGIGMMVFAEFGKFREAGVGISLSLFIVLCAALTFTPSLLRLVGRWAFWPRVPTERLSATAGWISATSLMGRLLQQDLLQAGWRKIGQGLQRRPATFLAVSIAAMVPFATIGVLCHNNLSYGLLSELPRDNASVIGARAVQAHFPAGVAGEVTVLLKHTGIDFASTEGIRLIRELTEQLCQEKSELGLADIRGAWHPLGVTEVAEQIFRDKGPKGTIKARLIRKGALPNYVSPVEDLRGHVTRIDLVFENDPFSRDSIQQLQRVEESVSKKLYHTLRPNVLLRRLDLPAREEGEPSEGSAYCDMDGDYCLVTMFDEERRAETVGQLKQAFAEIDGIRDVLERTRFNEVEGLRADASKTADLCLIAEPGHRFSDSHEGDRVVVDKPELLLVGETASIRDLKDVTDGDQIRIDILVLASVFLILVILLRQPAICLYLIVSVFFSYLATLGVTFAVFWLRDPAGFAGLDWKVPMFLFTILIAVGEDYNIFLMTRVREEQLRHGMVQGVTAALQKTGSIISSCGLIMAGTFSSLLAGTLVGMHQLGFALAFGVLLDTFVVRPILVPAYLILLHGGRFGSMGRWLGAGDGLEVEASPSTEVKTDD